MGHRDGIVAGIALELYRRQHGEYPQTLDVLVPQYLPQVPADRINGEAVKYRLVNGKPLIYSVGADHDDDGGRPPTRKTKRSTETGFYSHSPAEVIVNEKYGRDHSYLKSGCSRFPLDSR